VEGAVDRNPQGKKGGGRMRRKRMNCAITYISYQ